MTLEKSKGTKGYQRALTDEEVKIFKTIMDKHEKGLLFGISLACGLRPGEARALKWQDVDLKKNLITVSSAVAKGSLDIKQPKTASGIRTIPMPAWFADKLKGYIRHIDTPFVFFGTGKLPMGKQRYNRAWDNFHRLMDIRPEQNYIETK